MPRFSIVIPTYQRKDQVVTAIQSVLMQTVTDVEVVVVDDGSTDGTVAHLEALFGSSIKLISHIENRGRAAARNTGFMESTGTWIADLDSDDSLHPKYVETFSKLIEENPECRLFTCGASVFSFKGNWFRTRSVFTPKAGEEFGSGRIGTGSFMWHRDLFVELPEAKIPYGSDDSFSALCQKKYPELQKHAGQNESGQWKPLGNATGDDFVRFYIMTRRNSTCGVDLPLYLQSVR